MPTYLFKDKNTNKEWTDFLGISECEDYLKANPHIEQLVYGAPGIVSGVGIAKPADGFKDLLKEMKKTAGRTSTINV